MPSAPPPEREAHLHWVAIDGPLDDARRAAFGALMNDEERVRYERFLFEPKKDEFLVTRALVRTTLAHYAGIDPRDFTFGANAWGRPEIATPSEHASLRFNVSNTFGMVALIVARDREVGCDVEALDRKGGTVNVADRFFSAREVLDLHAVDEARQRDRFFDYWTLKEAYIKARGMGLAIPLGDFSFILEPDKPIAIEFAPELDDDPTSWQFAQLKPSARHRISIAIRRKNEPDLNIVVRETALSIDG
jgi:4'-phosphopantetheinyl transferase